MILTIDGSFKFSWLNNLKKLETVCLVFNSTNINKIYSQINLNNPLTISRNQKIISQIELHKKIQLKFGLRILTNNIINDNKLNYVIDQSMKNIFLNKASCFITINQFGTWSNSVIESISENLPILIIPTKDQTYNLGPFFRFGILINLYIANKKYFECSRVKQHINKKVQITWKEIHLKEISYLLNRF